MIRHIVMLSFIDEANGHSKEENIEIIRAMTIALPKKINTIRGIETAVNAPCADQTNADFLLVADFDTIEDVKAYQVHPEHQKILAIIVKTTHKRSCIDFEL